MTLGAVYISRQRVIAGSIPVERRRVKPVSCEGGLVEFEILSGGQGSDKGCVFETDFERLYEPEAGPLDRWDVRLARWLGRRLRGERS